MCDESKPVYMFSKSLIFVYMAALKTYFSVTMLLIKLESFAFIIFVESSFIKDKKYLSDKQIQAINDDVKERVIECEKFADESPYPEKQQLYDMVYVIYYRNYRLCCAISR